MEILNTWQFNLIAYYFAVVFYFQFYKLAVRDARHDGAATIVLQTIAGVSILLLLPFFPIAFPTNGLIYFFLLLACVFYALADRLNTTARKNLEVSTFTIVGQLSTVFLILIGLIFFKETLLITKIFGALAILAGNAILFYKRGEFKPNKYSWLAIIASAMFATAISIDIGISEQFNLPFYIMLTLIIPAVFTKVVEKIPIKQVIAEYKSDNQMFYIITAVAWGLTIIFSLRAFQFGSVTTIVPLQSVQVLLNVLIAYIFLKEKKDKGKKIIAALLVIAGVWLTVM